MLDTSASGRETAMMILRRKLYQKLLDWKNKYDGSRALLIEGAHRVGKSFLVEQFGKNEYESHILIDFAHPARGVMDAFENDFYDLDLFYNRLSSIYNVKLFERRSLMIFDEVQMYPHARELIKYLVADGRYDFIETGSLISLKSNVENIVLPSEEKKVSMFPLDFEEFLWAMGSETLFPFIRKCFEERIPLGEGAHRVAMNRFREYMLVGGMPEPVVDYAVHKDFGSSDDSKRDILELYRGDIRKYAAGYFPKVLTVFDTIPAELSKKEKRFSISSLGSNARTRDYEDAFIWLTEGMIVNQCFNSTDPSVGLFLNLDLVTHKLYMGDTGLLVTHAFRTKEQTDNGIYRAILNHDIHINEGMIAENVVAQLLRASGHELFFYSRRDPEDSRNTMEIDFLVIRGGKVCPVEVKSSGHLRHSSLDKFRERFGKRIGEAFMLHPGDVKEKDGIACLPIYMAGLL